MTLVQALQNRVQQGNDAPENAFLSDAAEDMEATEEEPDEGINWNINEDLLDALISHERFFLSVPQNVLTSKQQKHFPRLRNRLETFGELSQEEIWSVGKANQLVGGLRYDLSKAPILTQAARIAQTKIEGLAECELMALAWRTAPCRTFWYIESYDPVGLESAFVSTLYNACVFVQELLEDFWRNESSLSHAMFGKLNAFLESAPKSKGHHYIPVPSSASLVPLAMMQPLAVDTWTQPREEIAEALVQLFSDLQHSRRMLHRCENCNVIFATTRIRHVYCTDSCKNTAKVRRARSRKKEHSAQ